MKLTDISEIVAGLTIIDRLPPDAVDTSRLAVPYNKIVEYRQQGMDFSQIMDRVGMRSVNAALMAGEAVNGNRDVFEYLTMQENIYARWEAGTRLSQLGKRLTDGEEVDHIDLLSAINRLDDGIQSFVRMGDVEAADTVWRPSFYPPLDQYIGGYPIPGLTLLAAPPGTGKTTLITQLLLGATQAGKEIGFFSLEMTLGLIKKRMLEVDPMLTKEQANRMIASDEVWGIDECYAGISKLMAKSPDLWFIAVDFADLLIPARLEASAPVVGRIYRLLAQAAKKLGIPIILCCQLNDKYIGGVPRVNHIRWSRLAEAVASMIILIYNPDQLWVDMGQNKKRQPLEYIRGRGYLIMGKSRYGYGKQNGVGAIQVEWEPARGWSKEAMGWFELAGA